jgi:sugar lactone lactonase YvrE
MRTMKLTKRGRWTAAASTAVIAASAAGLAMAGSGGRAAAAGVILQTYDAPCPASDAVTPALNVNLIENTSAEDYTAATALGAPAGDPMTIADCWTSSSPLPAPDGTQESSASTWPGVVGKRDFYGGTSPADRTVTIAGTSTTGTQLINVSSLNAGGQPFELSGALGGYESLSDDAVVAATFEDANGATLGSASIGPVTESDRGGVTELLSRAWFGTVPAGTTQVLITITTNAIGKGADDDGAADDLNLTIGSSAAPSGPVLQTLPYTAPAGSDGDMYRPAGISADNGTVYVSNTGDSVVLALESGNTSVIAGSLEGSGEHGDGSSAGSATLYQPGGTAVDAKGDIFIADSGDNVVREITPDGVIHRFAGTGIAGSAPHDGKAAGAELDHPEAVAVNANGDVFIADTYSNRVLEATPGGSIRVVAGNGRAGYAGDNGPAAHAELNQPTGVAVDAQGNLYIADSANNVIRRVDAKTGIITTVAGDYAADKANDGLGGFSGDGGPATSAQLNDPQGVAVDGAGDLFIADTFNNAIREVTPAGIISTVVNYAGTGGAAPAAGAESSGKAPTASHLNTPYAVAVDPSTGVLYIADTHNSEAAEVLGLAKTGTAASNTPAGPVAPSAQH